MISVLPVPAEYNPRWVYRKCEDGRLALYSGEPEPIPRRQELPAAYHREGSVYVTRAEVIRTRRTLYGSKVVGYEMPREFSSNIDTVDDWIEVETRMMANRSNAAI